MCKHHIDREENENVVFVHAKTLEKFYVFCEKLNVEVW